MAKKGKKTNRKRTRPKLGTLVKHAAESAVDIAVYGVGYGSALVILNEGTDKSTTITQHIAAKQWDAAKNAVKDSRNALKRGDFWLSVGAPPAYSLAKAGVKRLVRAMK